MAFLGILYALSSVQLSLVTQSCLTLCNPMDCSTRQPSPSFTNPRSLFKLVSIKSVMPSNHLIFYHPLLLLPSIFPSIRLFSNESVLCIRRPKYWSFSFSISPSNEYSGLISFRIDWMDLLVVQGTLKSLLQHHSSKASVLWFSAFFIVQLSHSYTTTGKIIALTRQTFVGKVILLSYMSFSGLMLHLGCTESILIYMCIHINLKLSVCWSFLPNRSFLKRATVAYSHLHTQPLSR